jgi:hypothetical protein
MNKMLGWPGERVTFGFVLTPDKIATESHRRRAHKEAVSAVINSSRKLTIRSKLPAEVE